MLMVVQQLQIMDMKWNDWEFLAPLQEFLKQFLLLTVKSHS